LLRVKLEDVGESGPRRTFSLRFLEERIFRLPLFFPSARDADRLIPFAIEAQKSARTISFCFSRASARLALSFLLPLQKDQTHVPSSLVSAAGGAAWGLFLSFLPRARS